MARLNNAQYRLNVISHFHDPHKALWVQFQNGTLDVAKWQWMSQLRANNYLPFTFDMDLPPKECLIQ